MNKPFDVMARGLIEGALSGPCVVRVEESVVADARSIDALVEPIDARSVAPLRRVRACGS